MESIFLRGRAVGVLLFTLAGTAHAQVSWIARSQTTWYVDANGTPPGSGTQANPYTDLQYAIAQATTLPQDILLVLPGTYHGPIDFLGKALDVHSQAGPSSTELRGDPSAVPPASVVRIAGHEGPGTRLAGFTIREGNGTPGSSGTRGGGLYVDGSSPILEQLVVVDNRADQGGGAWIHALQAKIIACSFEDNEASAAGGGLFLRGLSSIESATVQDSSFVHNVVTNGVGGGVAAERGLPGFLNCLFLENQAQGSSYGGGLYYSDGGVGVSGSRFERNGAETGGGAYAEFAFGAAFENCEFVENTALATGPGPFGGGAGVKLSYCGGFISHCTFRRNVAESSGSSNMFGGGVYADESSLWLSYSVFDSNRTDRDGGGVHCTPGESQTATVNRCTFFGNQASIGDAVATFSGVDFISSIAWGNGAKSVQAGSGDVGWSDVQGGHAGVGNLDLDPEFWDALGGDFALKPGSPCIDAGNPAEQDPDGSRFDQGALTFDPNHCGTPRVYCMPKINSQGCTPLIDFAGSPSLAGPDELEVTASQVLGGQPGILFWSLTESNAPFGGGTLCVGSPVVRTPVQNSGGTPGGVDCSGGYAWTFTPAYLAAHGLSVGATVFAQFYSRDPGFPVPDNIGLTAGLRFVVCP